MWYLRNNAERILRSLIVIAVLALTVVGAYVFHRQNFTGIPTVLDNPWQSLPTWLPWAMSGTAALSMLIVCATVCGVFHSYAVHRKKRRAEKRMEREQARQIKLYYAEKYPDQRTLWRRLVDWRDTFRRWDPTPVATVVSPKTVIARPIEIDEAWPSGQSGWHGDTLTNLRIYFQSRDRRGASDLFPETDIKLLAGASA
ncbi:MAG TPA: hypothetical protein VLF67_02840 [Candidatus Saccharimonas sp.]|nr:hypothetical protein [Candidatus Saccharimonas sp.]